MKLFFDTEFTGLHQTTTLVSLGIVDENGRYFYAEFTDYDKSQINDWLQNNIIDNLQFTTDAKWETNGDNFVIVGDSKQIKSALTMWLEKYKDEQIEFWSDVYAYDWVLFNGLLADYSSGYPVLPQNIYYIPFDLATAFKIKGIDPDISRNDYAGGLNVQHNALSDATVIKKCYEKVMEIK